MPKVTITIEDSEEGNNIIKINTDFDAAEFIEKEGSRKCYIFDVSCAASIYRCNAISYQNT